MLIIGSNFAEAHPVGFQWAMEARTAGTKIIHVDPRFSRTSASADQFVPIRPGTDIAFIGGLINYVLTGERHFAEFVEVYTNADHIVAEGIELPDELDGLFSGWMSDEGRYDTATWQFERDESGAIASDPTLTHPRCVMSLLRRHYARYTPQMVSDICGISPEAFARAAGTFTSASGRDRTGMICYAVGLTMHTKGVQNIRSLGVLQLLLGNIGRPGGGILALRGHANVQGATDLPVLYDLLPGYLPKPNADDTDLATYLERVTKASGWWANTPAYTVSLLKAWFGNAATDDNDYFFDRLPRLTGDHSYMVTQAAMADGAVEGMMVAGENVGVSSVHGSLQRSGFRKLRWMVVRDLTMIETAEFWKRGEEYDSGKIDPADVDTEVFLFPAAAHVEKEGSFTNTQRILQWKDQAVQPPGDARSELWFVHHLMARLKKIYAGSDDPKDAPILDGTWDYTTEGPVDEPAADEVLAEIGGFGPHGPLASFGELRDDGTTAAGAWTHVGVTAGGDNHARNRDGTPGERGAALDWGWAWPANRRNLYNRASADPEGRPWSEEKAFIWWDETAGPKGAGAWVGHDTPDFPIDRAPSYRPGPDATGTDLIAGDQPFIMQTDGLGALWVAEGLRDGPLPTHYEPLEGVAPNRLYRQQHTPERTQWDRPDNPYHWAYDDPRFPFVLTTYRLTETFGSGTMANRNLSWLGELQPELFCEISPQLAELRGIEHGGWVTMKSLRAEVEMRVLVTRRLVPLQVADRTVHTVGLPYQWGRTGQIGGASPNELQKICGEPNVTIEECKAITIDLVPGRVARNLRAGTDGPLQPEPDGEAPARDLPSVTRPAGPHGVTMAADKLGGAPGASTPGAATPNQPSEDRR